MCSLSIEFPILHLLLYARAMNTCGDLQFKESDCYNRADFVCVCVTFFFLSHLTPQRRFRRIVPYFHQRGRKAVKGSHTADFVFGTDESRTLSNIRIINHKRRYTRDGLWDLHCPWLHHMPTINCKLKLVFKEVQRKEWSQPRISGSQTQSSDRKYFRPTNCPSERLTKLTRHCMNMVFCRTTEPIKQRMN